MELKEKYLEQTDIKVKNLLSELYESESKTQKEIFEIKKKLRKKINELENKHQKISMKRENLIDEYNELKYATGVEWESEKHKFNELLNTIEGDKDTFIVKAESVVNDLAENIRKIEEKGSLVGEDMKDELMKKAGELNEFKQELQNKIEEIKNDSSDRWRDIKHWFIEKSNKVKEYISPFDSHQQ